MNERATYHLDSHTVFGVLIVCLIVLVPISAHAGFLSIFFDTVAAKTSDETIFENRDGAQNIPLLQAVLHTDPNGAKGGGDILVADGVLVPSGDVDKKESKINTLTAQGEINVYVVRDGDTLSQIAEMFDVSAKTILWANNITDVSRIHPGDTLIILPITGVRHIVKSGDTIASIAKKYSGDVEDILSYNQLTAGSALAAGDTIIIPDGTVVSVTPPKRTATGGGLNATGGGSSGFSNPLPGSIKTQGIHGYNGVDLSGVSVGTPVLAAASGEIIVAKNGGWNGGYGSYVVVKHPNGTQTLYAHLSNVVVAVGQSVAKGEKVGGMGNTGRSTGPHLHFEVRGARNPF